MASSRQPVNQEPPQSEAEPRAICDYEGSTYQTDFWTHERTYEDSVERMALQAMVPPQGHRLIEIGAGFGRLVDLYAGYDQVILFDYSRSMLRQAQERWGQSSPTGQPHYIYVAGDFNALPFVPGAFDTATMVRVIHHAPDASHVLRGINEILAPGGTFVLEFANKRNLKSVTRWLLRRQSWTPFDPDPYEFVELNFNFHPHWIQSQLELAGFAPQEQRSVSHFRLGVLKRAFPTHFLARLDGLLQSTGQWWQLTPSVFVKSKTTATDLPANKNALFRCPICRDSNLAPDSTALTCTNCGRAWSTANGLFDFKEPIGSSVSL
jgi:ubiquinone/menaquinone biosynthesis C-methylase UbiE